MRSALAAGMILRAVGGVVQLLPRRIYPWKLWGLLLPGAAADEPAAGRNLLHIAAGRVPPQGEAARSRSEAERAESE